MRDNTQSSRSTQKIAVVWLAIAFLAIVALFYRHRNLSLDGSYQGWGSASCMIMARSFTQLGLWHTHFVPVQNNLPLGAVPDVYLHWPPLYPIVLSGFLRVLGDSPASGRALELLIILLSSALVWLIADRLYARLVATLAAFIYLSVPATFVGASAILQQPLSMLFALGAFYCYLRAIGAVHGREPSRLFSALGVASIALMIFSAWDPVFVPFGLLVTAIYLRDKPAARLAAIYCVTAVLAFSAVQTLYITSYPKLFTNQIATIAYRAGMAFHGESGTRLATIVDNVVYDFHPNLSYILWGIINNILAFFPTLVLAGAMVFVALWLRDLQRKTTSDESTGVPPEAMTWTIGGLLLPCVVWYLLMRNYVAIHSFVLVIASPGIAIAAAFVLARVWQRNTRGDASRPMRLALFFGFPLLMVLPLVSEYREIFLPAPQFANLAMAMQDQVPQGAIVLTPATSLLPVYYGQRHTIRGINSSRWLRWSVPRAHAEFSDDPLYFAVQDSDREGLSDVLPLLGEGTRVGDTVVYRINPALFPDTEVR